VWRAAAVAAATLGKPTHAFHFQVDSDGELGGPPAATALSTAFIAAATGADLAPDVVLNYRIAGWRARHPRPVRS
jgi:hypothetical protein